MSDEPKPEENVDSTPPADSSAVGPAKVETPASSPAETPNPASDSSPAQPAPAPVTSTPGASPPAPTPSAPRPVIDYAMPSQKKSWLPTPQMVRNLGCIFKMLFGFTILLILGYVMLMALNPKARQWALQGSKPGAPAPAGGHGFAGTGIGGGAGPTPFKAVNQILAIPAQALGKTDDVVKANNARVGQLDGVIKEEEGKAKGGSAGRTFAPVTDPFANSSSSVGGTSRPDKSTEEKSDGPAAVSRNTLLALAEKQQAAPAPSSELPAPSSRLPAPSSAPDTPDQLKLAGDIVIAQASPDGAPRASRAFFYWVVSLNVSGITQGKPARMLLNNRLAYEGDEVNRNLGITFAQLDAANRVLIFRDKSGATVTRSY